MLYETKDLLTKSSYGINGKKATQLLFAGFFASGVMVGFSMLLQALGVLAPDFGSQYGAILNDQMYPVLFSGFWWVGMVWHLINGTVIFSFLGDYLTAKQWLPTQRGAKGIVYGSAIWLFVGLLVAPMAGEGLFFRLTAEPFTLAVTTLLTWIVYGLVLESMSRVRVTHQLNLLNQRAA